MLRGHLAGVLVYQIVRLFLQSCHLLAQFLDPCRNVGFVLTGLQTEAFHEALFELVGDFFMLAVDSLVDGNHAFRFTA
ncbi:hypothetical protein EB73_16335 [Mycobacterium sp. SWH-M3]|nr:hypothetical protein EB73_16335 [Mycobacterium sp. SWH-M3]